LNDGFAVTFPTKAAELAPLRVIKFDETVVSAPVVAVSVCPFERIKPPALEAVVVAPSFHGRLAAEVLVTDTTVGELSTVTVNPFVKTSSLEFGA